MDHIDRGDITDYEFIDLEKKAKNDILNENKVHEFESYINLDGKNDKISKDKKLEEIHHAKRINFKIAPIVEEHRGLLKESKAEREKRIQEEVNRRIIRIQEKAYKDGYDEGFVKGKEESLEKYLAESDKELEKVVKFSNEVLQNHSAILKNQKKELFVLIKNLSKWVILRELKGDGDYITRLLEKLILEIDSKNNLFFKVPRSKEEEFKQALETIQKKLGEFSNIRIELDDEVENGIYVESENGIIDSNVDEQLKNLDELFKTVLSDE